MQLSFDKNSEVHQLRITLHIDERSQKYAVQASAHNRSGAQLATGGVVCDSVQESELLPRMLSAMAYGFLYRGARESVTLPMAHFRNDREALKERQKK